MTLTFTNVAPDEVLTLPDPRPGWRGVPNAEIRLAKIEDGWLSAAAMSVSTGGFGEPLGYWSNGRPILPTRQEALDRATAAIRRVAVAYGAPHIIKWLDDVASPRQGDMFA